MITWEAHKCVIRGEFIKWDANVKKDKPTLTSQFVKELLEARKALQTTLDLKSKHITFFKKRVYYERGGQSGKFLTKALKDTKV